MPILNRSSKIFLESSPQSSSVVSSESSVAPSEFSERPESPPTLKKPAGTTFFMPKPPPTGEPPVIQTLNKRSPFGALLSRTLPDYSGHYPVGVCDVEVPVPRQSFGHFKHKSMPNAEAGLTIDTVLFTLFYPAERTDTSQRVVWFPRLRQTIDGFLRMANRTPNWMYRSVTYPAAAAAIYGTTFPADENAALKQPPPGTKWPVMIFSHGVGCSRFMYSAFCGEMASRGYVVAAIEHRDGTGPSSQIMNSDGQIKVLDWLDWKDLYWPDIDQPKNDTTLRHVQLSVRLAETRHVLEALEKIASGERVKQTQLTEAQLHYDWTRWKNVSVKRPIMAGHSFGGSLGMAAAADTRFKFSRVIVFDPAVQRLHPWTGKINSHFLAINSEEFTMGAEFPMFLQMLPMISSKNVYLIPGSTHPSFSDVFLILPPYINKLTGLRIAADRVIDMMIHVVHRFLDGQRVNELGGGRFSLREIKAGLGELQRLRGLSCFGNGKNGKGKKNDTDVYEVEVEGEMEGKDGKKLRKGMGRKRSSELGEIGELVVLMH